MRHVVAFIAFLASASVIVCAEDSLFIRTDTLLRHSPISLTLGYGAALNNVVFTKLPGVESCCTEFTGAQGTSAGLGVSFRLVQLTPAISIQASAGGLLMTSPMSTRTREIVDYQGNAYDATIRHDLTMRYWLGQLSVEGVVAIAPWLQLSIGLGGALPIALTYNVSETIEAPDKLVFETGGVNRNQVRGSSPSAQAGLFVPVEIAGPVVRVGRELTVQPMIRMQQMLTSINSSIYWGATSFSAGVRLGLQREIVVQDTVLTKRPAVVVKNDPPVPMPAPERQKISLSAGVRDALTNQFVKEVDLSYNVKRRRLAVLPSIFFDSAKAVIPERFLQRKVLDGGSGLQEVRDIDVSHSILHVLGTTLQLRRESVVTVTGCHAEDVSTEDRNRLARARAEAVKTHLVRQYQIDSARIRIVTRAFPERASSVFTPFGRAENRRVDLELRDADYDLPVQPDTIVTAAPVSIEANIETSRPGTVKRVSLSLIADGFEIAALDTALSQSPFASPFVLTDGLKRRLVQSKDVEVAVAVQDSIDGVIVERVRAFGVVAKPDEEQPFDEFGIVLFDYNSSRIAESERGVIEDLKQRVSRADGITITGTSDESGSESENLRLAEERAQSVARALGLKPGTFELRSRIATDYSSFIPEGRMLGRQVKVVLRTGKK